MKNSHEEGAATFRRLEQHFGPLKVAHELRKIEDVARRLPREIVEARMFDSGHGLYLVPSGVHPPKSFAKVIVGWVDARAVVQALAETLPLMTH
ncbi:hypothetical protein DYH55_20325 [Methylovirgula sp. 4M-Z18]|nr:hypothetical protein DYH55_20325 [Methylovirgula sp. 4M-Z18]